MLKVKRSFLLSLVYWFESPAIAEFTKELQLQINGVLESVYAANDVPVADVAGAFMADADFSIDDNGNGWPDSVDLICLWTWMCSHQNIHANEEGYTVIAEQFYSVLSEIPVSNPPRKRFRKNGHR